MAFAQGTMTSVNASNDLRTIIDGLLTLAGWTLVETLTPSGVFRNSVYKSSGASNLCGYDWYLLVAWQTTGTEQVTSILGYLDYNTGTHVLSHGIDGPMGMGPTIGALSIQDTDGGMGIGTNATFPVSTRAATSAAFQTSSIPGGNTGSNAATPGIQSLFPSSAFAYWISITLDHVCLFTTISSGQRGDGVISTLALDSGYTADDNYRHTPLVCWNTQNNGSSGTFFTALGIKTTTAPSSSTNYVASSTAFTREFGARLPNITGTFYDAVAWKPYVWYNDLAGGLSVGNWTGDQSIGGLLIGQVSDFYLVHGGSIGDTVTIDSATYVLFPLAAASGLGPTTGSPTLTAALLVES